VELIIEKDVLPLSSNRKIVLIELSTKYTKHDWKGANRGVKEYAKTVATSHSW